MSIERRTDPESQKFWRRVDEAANFVQKFAAEAERTKTRALMESREAKGATKKEPQQS